MRIGFMMPFDKERIDFAVKVGFKSCELMVNPSVDYFPGKPDWQKKAKQVRAAYDEQDIRISCLAGYYVNHFDPDKEKEHRDLVRNVILLAEAMAVPVTAGFSGRIMKEPLEDSLSKFKEVWSEHARFAEDHGVKIAFEHCPMGHFHTPSCGINAMCTPAFWEKAFNEVPSPALGLEWDPSHLIGLFIDPVANLRAFGSRVHHVHAKDAHMNRDLLARYGIWHQGTNEHCFPGLGDTDWNLVIKELLRQGYRSDLNIEGWHDLVYRNSDAAQREDEGLVIAFRHLSQYVIQD